MQLAKIPFPLARMPWWDTKGEFQATAADTIERPMVTNRPEFLQGEFRATAVEEPVSKPRPRAADDFEEIRKRMQELERARQAAPGFEKIEMENRKPATPVTTPVYSDYC